MRAVDRRLQSRAASARTRTDDGLRLDRPMSRIELIAAIASALNERWRDRYRSVGMRIRANFTRL
jgi:hypothetical protein